MHKIQNKRKMLIVGGSGFLGYHLAKSALKMAGTLIVSLENLQGK